MSSMTRGTRPMFEFLFTKKSGQVAAVELPASQIELVREQPNALGKVLEDAQIILGQTKGADSWLIGEH